MPLALPQTSRCVRAAARVWVLLLFAVCANGPNARGQVPAHSPPFRDGFIDLSGRRGPLMVPIPQTEATVGARSNEADFGGEPEIRHHVRLSAFAAGQFEVTNAEFAAYLNDTSSQKAQAAGFDAEAGGQLRRTAAGWRIAADGEDLPVVGVSWRAAQAYARWLSLKTHQQYRLPTSAEWEVVARGGTETAWWWSDAADEIGTKETHAGHLRSVAGLEPNPWGLYGVEGNVWQWTGDCFHRDAAALAARQDPDFFDAGCGLPEIRGGSFKEGPEFARSAYRSNLPAVSTLENVGFRVVRVAGERPKGEGTAIEYGPGEPAEVWALASRGAGAPEFEGLTAGGWLPKLPRGLHLLLADTASGLVLFDGSVPESGAIRVHKVVRLTGKIAGTAAGTVVSGKVGTGERIAALDRWLRDSGATSPRDDRAKASFGVPLPLSPAHWQRARVVDGEVDSGWIFAESPQVVVFDSAGDVLVQDVSPPADIKAHASLDVGQLTLTPTRTLDVSVKLPDADLELPLTLGVHDVTLGEASAVDAGRYLAALDQIDPRLFGLLVLDHGYALPANGDAHVRYLPPYAAMTLLVHDPRSDQAIEKKVELKRDTTARVELAETRGSPASATFRGQVHLVGTGTAVAGATVVASQYPDRRETVTDGEGRFSVEGVSAKEPVDIAISVPAAAAGDIYVRSQVFRQLDTAKPAELIISGIDRRAERVTPSSAGQGFRSLNRPVAKGPSSTLNTPQCANLADDQYALYQSWLAEKDNVAQDEFTIQGTSPGKATISVCSTGNWNFLYADNVVRAYIGSGLVTENDKSPFAPIQCRYLPSCLTACYTKEFTMVDFQTSVDRVIAFKGGFLSPLGGLNVEISPISQLSMLDPTAVVSDKEGLVKLCGVDTNPIHIFASDPKGYYEYDCSINLLGSACQADVPLGVTNTPTACNKTLTPPSCQVK